MKKTKIILTSFMILLLFGNAALAVKYDTSDWNVPNYDGQNGYSAVRVSGMFESGDFDAMTKNLLSTSYDATGRAAFFDGNDSQDDGTPTTSLNIGQQGDGILNGDTQEWLLKDSDPVQYYTFDGHEFISELQDVDGIDGANDPGWIYIGKQDGAWQKEGENYIQEADEDGNLAFVPQLFSYETIGPFGDFEELNIGELINISLSYNFEDNGTDIISATWSLTPQAGILDKLQPLLGNNFFDHLAIVLKSSDYFAIYDLDFNKIFTEALLSDEYFVPVKLTGTLNNSDLTLKNGEDKPQAISHISFWAHDPIPSAVVPEPATLILLGAGLAGLAAMGIRRKKNN